MTFDNNDKVEQTEMLMSEVSCLNAQLQRGYAMMELPNNLEICEWDSFLTPQ
jgi:hypothetical protein